MTPSGPKRRDRISPLDSSLRDLLRNEIARAPVSRAQLADALAKILDEPVSLSRLDSFLASTKQSARLPAYFLPALAEALNSDAILLFLARPRTQKLLDLGARVGELRRIVDDLLKMEGNPRA